VAAGNHAKIDHSYSTGAVGGTGRTGGIAGEVQGNSSVKNCAALNFSVTATTDAGRVAGYISGTNTFSGNVAWEEMTVTTGSGEGGANITKAQVQNGSLLPDSLKTTPWSYTMGKLPTLIGLAGQSGALPVYLW
jgi:hypothetical protein